MKERKKMIFNFKCIIAYVFILYFKNSFICITLQDYVRPCKIRNKGNILHFIFLYIIFIFIIYLRMIYCKRYF